MTIDCEVCRHEHEGKLCAVVVNDAGDVCGCDAYLYDDQYDRMDTAEIFGYDGEHWD